MAATEGERDKYLRKLKQSNKARVKAEEDMRGENSCRSLLRLPRIIARRHGLTRCGYTPWIRGRVLAWRWGGGQTLLRAHAQVRTGERSRWRRSSQRRSVRVA